MKEIINKLYENGYEAYVVGGFVRDYLLGFESKDIDIATNAPIEEIKRIFKGRGKSYDKYFAYHIDENGYSYDITTYRKELKYKKNKPCEIEIAKDLETDLLRRDFTINTFALDRNGLFVDPLNAIKDLNAKIVKVVGNTTRKFNEDKTRIIRALRFACTLDFQLDEDIVKFITKRKTYLLNEVPDEYIKYELDKIFDSNGIDKFFYYARRYKISKYFKIEFDEIKKVYNRYGVWAQINTTLPLSRSELKTIKEIRSIVEKNNISYSDFLTYSKDVIYNAACILNLEKRVNAYKDIASIRSVIDIDIQPDILLDYVSIENVNKAYRQIERRIMEGFLENDKQIIEEYLRNINL